MKRRARLLLDLMQFFDLVALKGSYDSESLARRLGYKKIFELGESVSIVDNAKDLNSDSKKIVRSENEEVLIKALRHNSVIGALAYGNLPCNRIMETIRIKEKLLLLPIARITCLEKGARLQSLFSARRLLRDAMMSKVNISIVTLAEEKEYMLSAVQMLEIAKLLGVEQSVAERMLSVLGDCLR